MGPRIPPKKQAGFQWNETDCLGYMSGLKNNPQIYRDYNKPGRKDPY